MGPCLNPHCKSRGKPHPNCKCYSGGYAEGGEVKHFCESSQAHRPECEYFADGGDVDEVVPQDKLPDYLKNKQVEEDEVVPQDKIPKYLQGTQPEEDELVPEDKIPPELKPHDESWVEQAKAAAEGLSQGVFGAAAPWLETKLGISTKENIARRQEDFPLTHGAAEAAGFVGSLMTPASPLGLIGKGAEAVSEAANIGKVGSAILKGAIESASLSGSDEITKSFLGTADSDPEQPVSAALLHVGAAGLMGAITGGVFSFGERLIGKGVTSDAGAKVASRAQKFLFELGSSSNPAAMLGVSAAAASIPAYKDAQRVEEHTGIPAEAAYIPLEALYTIVGTKVISSVNPYIVSAAVRALSENEAAAVPHAVHYASQVAKGAKKAAEGVSNLFKFGAAKIADPVSESVRDKLKEFIEQGQVDAQLQKSAQGLPQQGFAKGGEVSAEPNESFSKTFPAQNVLLNSAKGRIASYLNGLRPTANQPKAPFDSDHKNSKKHREYKQALDIAISPLSILDRMNDGRLTTNDLRHFKSMYPESHKYLSQEMVKKITEAQLKKEKPPYAKRLAMSLFLGADLDSSMSPMAIQAVQNLYQNKKAMQAQQVPMSNKKGTSSLSKSSNSYLTDEQSREKRMQNQKA